MMDSPDLFYGSIILFFLGSILSLAVFRGGKAARRLSLLCLILASILLFAVSLEIAYTGKTIVSATYWVNPSVGFSFALDRLSAFFTLLISTVSIAVCIYSVGYVEHEKHDVRKSLLVALMGVFILSMVLVVSSTNTFSFLFFWELMSLSSFFMVLYDFEKEESRKAGIFYFIMTQLSAVFLFAAFLMMHQASGTFDMRLAGVGGATSLAVMACLFMGFGIKAGLIPFHKWLPYAHPASPSNISALMSGVMLKVAVYGFVRFILYDAANVGVGWGVIIVAFGTLSAILGVLYALKEHDIKRLLAYHSIENIGIIYIGLGLFVIFRGENLAELARLSLYGALFHTFNHGLFKSLLFMAAGSVVNAVGTRDIEVLGGLLKRMPYTALLFLVGAISISALPPFNGFVSELMIFTALLQSYFVAEPLLQVFLILCLSILALTSAFASACFVKAFGITFLAVPRSDGARKASESGLSMLVGPAVLAAACVFLGVFSTRIMAGLGYVSPLPDMIVVSSVLVAACGAVFFAVYFGASRKSRMSETWGCGIVSQNSRMEYTASGFSEPIMRMFKFVYRTREDGERRFYDRYGSVFKEGYAEIHLMKFFEQYIYMPIASFIDWVASSVAKLQNGHLDTYISYVFVAVLALLVAVGWLI
ncbi:MAG: proton-conducting transporter membrane subunit [Candidatus Altiarchaeota archaeon]